ncbi:MAG: response regulator [Nitrososphaeraceae archaeon]|nr:response regulator [Nitrososphaeraceae archaeon]MDW0135387.1 response regulator [Nitrososphaeraceae archaeon]MDW0155702.1 response regulator [Nitrososphaeraceae archaeon]
MSNNHRIVSIVDDEIDITELFQDALCSNIDGISVVSFNDTTLALEHYAQNIQNYALIISDMRMPLMTGLELLKKVKELNPNVRTMLLSAFDMQDNPDFQKYLKDGIIDSFLEKPISINRLCQEVRDEIETYDLGSKMARPQIKKTRRT